MLNNNAQEQRKERMLKLIDRLRSIYNSPDGRYFYLDMALCHVLDKELEILEEEIYLKILNEIKKYIFDKI